MRRYMLFGMNKYDCQGGINDFIKDFNTLDQVLNFLNLERITRSWWDIIDIKTKKHYEFLADNNQTLLTEISTNKNGSYELLKILTLKKFQKDMRKIIYTKCLNNCKHKFEKIDEYYL